VTDSGDGATADGGERGERAVGDGPRGERAAGGTAGRTTWLLVVLGFVVVEAAGFGMRGAVLPDLGVEFGASPELQGLVPPAGTVGFVVVLLAVGVVAGRLDLRATMVVGAVALAVAYLGLAVAPTMLAFLALMFVRGSVTGVFRGVDRPVLGHLFPDRRGRVFNLYDLAWAGGASLGPVALVVASWLGDWRYAYVGLGLALVPVAVAAVRVDLPVSAGVERPFEPRDLPRTLKNPQVAGAAVAMLCVGGLEGGIYTWLPTYAEAHLSPDLATLSVSAFTLSYIPARAVYGAVVERVGYVRMLAVLAIVAVPTAYLTFAALSGPALLVGVVALGVLWAGMFPTLIAFAVSAAPEHSGPISALTSSAAYAGIAVVPAGMGVVVGSSGVAAAMGGLVAVVAVTALVLVGTWVVGRHDAVTAAARPES
jgi:MFS family permease